MHWITSYRPMIALVLAAGGLIVVPQGCAQSGAMQITARGPAHRGAGSGDARSTDNSMHDPALGQHWVLQVNAQNPGAPGHWVLTQEAQDEISSVMHAREAVRTTTQSVPIVQAGGHVQVVQRSSVIDARLDGVAISSAGLGEELSVRLRASGRLIRAKAIAQGLAEWVAMSAGGTQ